MLYAKYPNLHKCLMQRHQTLVQDKPDQVDLVARATTLVRPNKPMTETQFQLLEQVFGPKEETEPTSKFPVELVLVA